MLVRGESFGLALELRSRSARRVAVLYASLVLRSGGDVDRDKPLTSPACELRPM